MGLGNPEKTQAGWSRREVLLGGLAAACSADGELAEGEQGPIARVMDGDALALDTGLKVRLPEVEAPAPGYGRRKDEPCAEEARALLNAAALGQALVWQVELGLI